MAHHSLKTGTHIRWLIFRKEVICVFDNTGKQLKRNNNSFYSLFFSLIFFLTNNVFFRLKILLKFKVTGAGRGQLLYEYLN